MCLSCMENTPDRASPWSDLFAWKQNMEYPRRVHSLITLTEYDTGVNCDTGTAQGFRI